MMRASSIRLAVLCPASVSAPRKVQVNSFDATATDGSDVHRAISLTLKGEPFEGFTGPNAADKEAMVEMAVDWLNDLYGRNLPGIKTELALTHGDISGTIDVAILATLKEAGLVDWKATFREDDYWPQLYAYAWLLFNEYPDLDIIHAYVPYLRRKGADHKKLSRGWIIAWMEEFKRNVIAHPEIHNPGEHCLRCRRRVGCEAIIETTRQAAIIMADDWRGGIKSRTDLASLRPRVKMLEAAIKEYDRVVRDEVLANGPIPLGDTELRAVESHIDKIKALTAWPILQETFTDDELGEIVAIGKTKMLDAVADKTPKGKEKARAGFMDKLRSAGAVETAPQIKIMECKVKELV